MLKLSERGGSQADTQILLDAISNDKIHLARFILDALDGKIVDSRSDGAQTPLISAVFLQDSHARCRFMNLLLQKGANVNHPDESGRTALSYACEMGHLDAVKILVKNGADPETADTWGNTALMYAVVAGRSAVVGFLVRAFKRLGLQIERQNKVGNSAVELAKRLGHTACLQPLLSSRRICGDVLAEDLSAVTLAEDTDICPVEDGTRAPSSLTRKRSLGLRNRIQSMDSIKEHERESDAPQRASGPHHQLPPLPSGAPPSGPLGILLTPLSQRPKEQSEGAGTPPLDLPFRRFDDTYYAKRCSLPTSVLPATAPERRRTVVKPTRNTEVTSRSLTALSGRLLRRFTFPEFKRSSKEPQDSCARSEASVCIPRSESFPLEKNHPQVGSKPSIDSISAVKCEFDFQCKAAPNV